MKYSQEIIEEVRIQNDIVDVISDFMPLTKKGNSYFGLCPFHNENTPSFSVSADKQFYYCFGCGAGGNVYSFIMQTENCDFLEALNKLADRACIVLPETEKSEKEKQFQNKKQKILEIHKVAGRFYYECLHSENGKKALEYINSRGILINIQKKFGLGYSKNSVDSLYKYLLSKGYDIIDILDSGLVIKNKNSEGYHDRFIDRIMFPIMDISGNIIGFGGRALNNGEPKYLNSPETIIFNKSKNLYGLNFAKLTRKRELILVEGYIDMISIYQVGIRNVCASLGTAFNTEHAKVLKKYADDIIILYDSDIAGTNAALRAIDVLVNNGFNVKVLQVKGCKDPDDFIKQNGVLEFSKLLMKSVNYISFKINCKRKEYNIDIPEHKVKFTIECAKLLSGLKTDIEKDVYINEVSKETGISREAIIKEINKIVDIKESDIRKELNYNKKTNNNYNKTSLTGIIEAQKQLLYILSTNIDVYNKVKNYIKPSDFSIDVYINIARIIYNINDNDGVIFPAEIINHFDSIEEQRVVTEIFAFSDNKCINNNYDLEKAVNENIKLIKRAFIENTLENTKNINIEEYQLIMEYKKNIDNLYINLSSG